MRGDTPGGLQNLFEEQRFKAGFKAGYQRFYTAVFNCIKGIRDFIETS